MNTVESIFCSIQAMQIPQGGQYSLSKIELSEADVYYGKDSADHSVFAMVSQNTKLRVSVQKTRKLVFWFSEQKLAISCFVIPLRKQSDRQSPFRNKHRLLKTQS